MDFSDADLLNAYVKERSDIAFRQLVVRYESLVRGCAMRQVRQGDLAEDVAQAVFIVLARRAATIRGTSLGAWLISTTSLCARDALRLQSRRIRHEQQAATMRPEPTSSASGGVEMAEYIDAALAKLPDRDASALALRYLQDKPVNEVAQTLGVTPDAAGKIISRALTRLRELLTRGGVTNVGTSSLSALVIMPSPSFVDSTVYASLNPSAGSFCLEIADTTQAAMRRTMVAATTATVVAGAVVLSLVATTAYAFWPADRTPREPEPVVVVDTAFAAQPTAMPFASPFIELVGCRIKQIARVTVGGESAPVLEWYENQAVQIDWIAESLPAGQEPLDVSIAAIDDAGASRPIWTRRVAANVRSMPYLQSDPRLPTNWLPAGDYQIQIVRGQSVLGSQAVRVEAMPDGWLEFWDVQPDGRAVFTTIGQFISSSPTPLGSSSIYFDLSAKLDQIIGDDLKPIEFKPANPGQYRFSHNPPVLTGEPILYGVQGEQQQVRKRPDGRLAIDVMVGSRTKKVAPCRRITLIRLPAGAEDIEVTGTRHHKVVDGRMHVFHDVLVGPPDRERLTVTYRLAPPTELGEGR